MRWSKEERAKGLAAVCQGKRGMELKEKGERLASVRPLFEGQHHWEITGWYWYAAGHNTHSTPCQTMEQAMAEALSVMKAERVKRKEVPQ